MALGCGYERRGKDPVPFPVPVSEIEETCRQSMALMDSLPRGVREAVWDCKAYPSTFWITHLVKKHGADVAAEIVRRMTDGPHNFDEDED
jgi:hypothetical protein